MNKKIMLIEGEIEIRYPLKVALRDRQDMTFLGSANTLERAYDTCHSLSCQVIIMDGKFIHEGNRTYIKKMMALSPKLLIVLSKRSTYESLQKMKDKFDIHEVVRIDELDANMGVAEIIKLIDSYDRVIQAVEKRFHARMEATYAKVGEPIIAIGASTGGVTAIETLLLGFDGEIPPILMVQHMSKTFTAKMAGRLSKMTKMVVKEAEHGERVRHNVAYLAPGDQHMTLEAKFGGYYIHLDQGPLVHFQRPAVENLFNSVADVVGKEAIGVLLTGMGRDGAQGLLKMREAGAYTLAQDASTSVVFGMPKAAIEIGGACEVVRLPHMADRVKEISRFSPKYSTHLSAV